MPTALDQFQSVQYHNLETLNQFRHTQAGKGGSDRQALEQVAKQFESMFTSMLFASMRSANKVFEDEHLFDTRYVSFYQEMLDKQLSSDVSGRGGLGVADLLLRAFDNHQQRPDLFAQRQKAFTPPAVKSAIATPLHKQTTAPLEKSNLGEVKLAHIKDASAPLLSSLVQVMQTKPQDVVDMPYVSPPMLAPSATTQATTSETKEKRALFTSPQDFVRQILPLAQKAAGESGLHPLALVAQSALESGWGQKMMQKTDGQFAYNLFGIKAQGNWQGEHVRAKTVEFEQGVVQPKVAAFRAYGSLKESIDDFVGLITGHQRYAKAKAVAHQPSAYFEALQQAGYATDPYYADKLKSVFATVQRIVTGIADVVGGTHGR